MDLDVPKESAHVPACPDSHRGLLLYEAAHTSRRTRAREAMGRSRYREALCLSVTPTGR
jgi:hypothetical protein